MTGLLVAQALLRSRRRRGGCLAECSRATDKSQGKTATVDQSAGQEAREHPGTSILGRVHRCAGQDTPGAPAPTYSLSEWKITPDTLPPRVATAILMVSPASSASGWRLVV